MWVKLFFSDMKIFRDNKWNREGFLKYEVGTYIVKICNRSQANITDFTVHCLKSPQISGQRPANRKDQSK